MILWNDPRDCAAKGKCINAVDGKPKVFTPKRRWQKFCVPKCGDAFNSSRLVRRKPAASARIDSDGCNSHLSTRRPSHAICWQRGRGFKVTGDRFQGTEKQGTGRPVLRVYDNGVVAGFRLVKKVSGARCQVPGKIAEVAACS